VYGVLGGLRLQDSNLKLQGNLKLKISITIRTFRVWNLEFEVSLKLEV
jgi:hypothetical protein